MRRTLTALIVALPALAAVPERIFLFSNSMRDLAQFRAFAETASRMKRYGRVQIDIGVLASKADFELPAGGNEWHQYAVFNANLSKFFPYPTLAPYRPADWVRRNRELLLAKAATLRHFGLEAALSSNDTHYMPEAFFERYPDLRGPRVDHPRRSRREEFSMCVDLLETREMIEWMAAEARRQVPELRTILVHTNDSGTGLCWADKQYTGPNGPEHCRRRPVGRRVADYALALHRGAERGGGPVDVRIGGAFSERELDEIQRDLPPRTYLSGRDPILVGGHGDSGRDPSAMGVATLTLETYPVLGLVNPLGLLEAMERYTPSIRTLALGTALPWYYRFDEPVENAARLVEIVEAAIAAPVHGQVPRLRKLRELAVKWGGEANADRLSEALLLIDEAVKVKPRFGRYSNLYSAVSTRHLTRPLLLRPQVLSPAEESYFLPYIFNISEAEARDDYIDIHGGRVGPSADQAAWPRFVACTTQAAAILDDLPNAPQQRWFHQMTLSLRMWVSVMESIENFTAGQKIRDANRTRLAASPHEHFKDASSAGDPDYFRWYQVERRELDNTSALIKLLNAGGLAFFAHAARPEDEDTFLLGPNILHDLETKRRLMRLHWLDAQHYFAPPLY